MKSGPDEAYNDSPIVAYQKGRILVLGPNV